MTQLVSITSQGQISIPAEMRRILGIDKYKKAFINLEGKKLVIEPVADILTMAGSLQKYAIKNKSIDKIIRLEKKAWESEAVKRYKKSLSK